MGQFNWDPAVIGKVIEDTEAVTVTAQQIKDYCAALGETDPLSTDEAAAKAGPYGRLIAPPTFVLILRTGRDFFDHIPRLGNMQMDAGRDLEFLAPVKEGDRLHMVSQVKEIYEKTGRSGAMAFVVIRSTIYNQHNQAVSHVDHHFMQRNR
jgi:acyl dehydratase